MSDPDSDPDEPSGSESGAGSEPESQRSVSGVWSVPDVPEDDVAQPPRASVIVAPSVAAGATTEADAATTGQVSEAETTAEAGVSPAPSPLDTRDLDDRDLDDLPPRPPRNRRMVALTALGIVAGVALVTFVFLGRANSRRYLLVCGTDHVSAEQGRAFPPWGSRPLAGPEWKAIPLPPSGECEARETTNEHELAGWFLDRLVNRASTALSAREVLAGASADTLDEIVAEINQALLLARAPEHRDQRKEIERLLGDVDYWRAAARLRDVSSALVDAAKQFDEAATRRPRHVTDAAVWATFVRRLADELRAGPDGPVPGNVAPAPSVPPGGPSNPNGPAAPTGGALPVEPASPEAPPAPPPDAGVPAGGVLL